MTTTEWKAGDGYPLAGTRLGVTGKGGAGKSTVSVLLAKELATRGYEVFLLDADSTNVGLHRALGILDPPTPLLDFFGGMVFSGGRVTCPVDDPTPIPTARVSLSTLPTSFFRRSEEGICLLSGGKLGDLGPGAGCDGPVSKIARDLEVQGDGNRVVTIVDLKAGMEDLTRGVITSLDWAITVVDPSLAAIEMVGSLGSMVAQIRAGAPPATAHLEDPSHAELAKEMFREARVKGVLVVLNRVADITAEVHLAGKISKKAPVELMGALKEDLSIGRAWFDGLSLHSLENEARIRGIVDRVEAAEGRRLDSRVGSSASGARV